MRKLPLFKEALLATILVMITVFAVNFFPLKVELAKPVKQELGDFDIYDLQYSGLAHHTGTPDTNIVIVQVGETREEIVEQLKKLAAAKPAVIGIDVEFNGPRKDTASDAELDSLVHRLPAIVTGFRLVNEKNSGLSIMSNYFEDSLTAGNSGYFNFLGEDISVVRYYYPFLTIRKKREYAFTSRIIEKYDARAFQRLSKRGTGKLHAIKYSGNINRYMLISRADLMEDSLPDLTAIVKGKIVLLGVIYTDPPLLLDDIHFTPLNDKTSGKSNPDMYGVVIHANVLSMIISGKYITLVPVGFTYLLAGLFVFLMTLYLLRGRAGNRHIPHWKLIAIQLLSIIIILYIFIFLFGYFSIKFELLPFMLAIVIGVEMFGIYNRLSKWLMQKMKFKSAAVKKKPHRK